MLLIAGQLTIQWGFLERSKGQLHALLTPCFPCTRCSLVSRLSLSLSLCLAALSLIVYSKFTWATMERETAKYGSNAACIGPKVMGISHFLPPSSLESVFTEIPHKTPVISIHLFYFPPPVTTIKLRSWIIEPKYNSALEVSFQCTSLNDTLALSVRWLSLNARHCNTNVVFFLRPVLWVCTSGPTNSYDTGRSGSSARAVLSARYLLLL